MNSLSAIRRVSRSLPFPLLNSIPSRYASQVVTMPALSPTMTSGKIAKWTKKEGDKVTSGETIGEVETDKASVDFVFQDEGYIAKFLVKEGAEDVPVGSPVCIVVDEASEIAAAQAAPAPVASPTKPAPAPVPATPAATPKSTAAPQVPSPVKVVASAPVAAAPAPAPAPAAKPAPVVAAVSAAASSSGGGDYLAFERWGSSLARASMGAGVARAQRAYTDVFGYSGHDPLPVADEEKAAKTAKPTKA
jgi:pyruvate/2-oxoglutarate dehydrogenase complex dihydrolipoamide acyltransferase (E2) component